jgi:putative transposase
LPTKTDCVDSGSNSSSTFAGALKCDSWFTIEKKQAAIKNSPRIFWPSSTSLLPVTTGEGQAQTGSDGVRIKTRTFCLKPTRKQRRVLAQWFGVYRWTYNQCVSAYYSGQFKPCGGKRVQQGALRAICVNKTCPLLANKSWVLKVPYDVRDEALREFLNNLNTELGKGTKFRLSYKSREDRSSSIQVLKKHWKNGHYCKTSLPGKLRTTEGDVLMLEKDSKLVKTRYNTYSLCVVYESEDPITTKLPSNSVALDPGVRTFMTGYDPSGNIVEIGKGDSNALFKMCRGVDKVMSRVATATNHKSRYQRKRAGARMRQQIKNRIKDLHRKAAKYLCETYKTIFLPVFGPSQMVRKRNRKIRSKTVRQMLTFSHYQFRQHLLHKAKDYNGCRVVLVDEAYTSKTCSRCGHIKQKLGGAKVYHCKECGLVIDRDINGARNIWIRSVEEVAGPHGAVTLWGLPPAI